MINPSSTIPPIMKENSTIQLLLSTKNTQHPHSSSPKTITLAEVNSILRIVNLPQPHFINKITPLSNGSLPQIVQGKPILHYSSTYPKSLFNAKPAIHSPLQSHHH